MTRSTHQSPLPGNLLLRFATLVFDEPTLTSVIHPALADLQQELRDAGASRTRRLLARARGYWAFWVLVAVIPFAFLRSPISGRVVTTRPATNGGAVLLLLVVVFFAGTWPVFSWFVVGAVIGGILLAMAMRWWHNRHPGAAGPPDPRAVPRDPEINLSAIPVGGNIGGFMFVAGSVAIVMLGLPELRWFFLAALLGGVVLAGGLFAWRTTHPSGLLPENSLARHW